MLSGRLGRACEKGENRIVTPKPLGRQVSNPVARPEQWMISRTNRSIHPWVEKALCKYPFVSWATTLSLPLTDVTIDTTRVVDFAVSTRCRKMNARVFAAALVLAIVGKCADGGVIVSDTRFTPILRASFQGFPIQVDSSGRIYTVTSTSTSAALDRINVDNSVETLNPSVGAVIGVLADLDFGFAGDLFANAAGRIRRFSNSNYSGSDFATRPLSPDGGLAFDSVNQLMWVTGDSDLFAYDGSGNLVETIVGATQGGPSGLDIDSTGDLVLLLRGGILNGVVLPPEIVRVDTSTKSISQIVNLKGYGYLRGIAVGSNDELFFTTSNPLTGQGFIYRVGSDGSGLSLVATNDAQINGICVGLSGDGTGRESIYLAASNTAQFYELRPVAAVPEPSSMTIELTLLGMLATALLGQRLWVGSCVIAGLAVTDQPRR